MTTVSRAGCEIWHQSKGPLKQVRVVAVQFFQPHQIKDPRERTLINIWGKKRPKEMPKDISDMG